MAAYDLPDLPYAYDALEPHFDARTMEIHHAAHHQACVDALGSALASSENLQDLADQPVDDLLWNFGRVPEERRRTVRNLGGGHANHSLFWSILSPDGGGEPTGALADALDEEFGSFAQFQRAFGGVAASHFGSGWAWLVRARNRLVLYSLPNEDSPLTAEESPLLGLDLWEHAYFLRYEADRQAYVDAFWNVVNWQEVSRRFDKAAR